MQCSKLNHHLFLLHVVDSPACGHNIEDSSHYLLECPLFDRDRIQMYCQIAPVVNVNQIGVKGLLYGVSHLSIDDNLKIFDAVHGFIAGTGRL